MKSIIAIPFLALLAMLLVCISAHEFDTPERYHFGVDGIDVDAGRTPFGLYVYEPEDFLIRR